MLAAMKSEYLAALRWNPQAALKAAAGLAALIAERELRERIAAAIEPLKGLVALAEGEARAAMERVSGRTRELFREVYYDGRELDLAGASINKKKALHADAVIGDVMLDATLVANTSWLRAFLWAFVFALRERVLEDLGYNPLPLFLLDDPQATFDECHERQWAILLAEMAAPGAPGHRAAQTVRDQLRPAVLRADGAARRLCRASRRGAWDRPGHRLFENSSTVQRRNGRGTSSSGTGGPRRPSFTSNASATRLRAA